MWIVTYLIAWSILVLTTSFLKRNEASILVLAITAALFGLSFGLIDSLIHSFVFGFHTFMPLWLRGLPWDFIHATSNYLTVLLLFKPIMTVLKQMKTSGN